MKTESPVIQIEPIALEGNGVRLEPLKHEHHDALMRAAADGEIWRLWYTFVPKPEETRDYIGSLLKRQQDGNMLPWVVREVASGEIIGSTTYHDIVPAIDRVWPSALASPRATSSVGIHVKNPSYEKVIAIHRSAGSPGPVSPHRHRDPRDHLGPGLALATFGPGISSSTM